MSFLKAIFDDRDHSVQAAHVVAIILTLASIGWVTYLVYHNHILPDLSGIAYLLGGSGAMNVASKMETIIEKFKTPPPMTAPPPAA